MAILDQIMKSQTKKGLMMINLNSYTIISFDQVVQNYLKVFLGSNVYNPTKNEKVQISKVKRIQYSNWGGYLLQKLNDKCSDKNGSGKTQNFLRSTETSPRQGKSGTTSQPPIGSLFMDLEPGAIIYEPKVYFSFQRTDMIDISNISFNHNRYSTGSSNQSMGRIRLQLLLDDNTWSNRYNIPNYDRYSNSSTQMTLFSLIFNIEIFGIKLFYNEIDTALADLCSSIKTLTQSVP